MRVPRGAAGLAACFLADSCGKDAPPAPAPPAAAAPRGDAEPRPRERPDILLIVVDTLRADHLGCYGYARPTSPNVDRFAAEATLFERATSAAPWTTPSIGALFSSRPPSVLGIRGTRSALPDEAVLLPEVLRERGWATGAVISHSLCSSRWNFDQGFESFDESNVLGHDVSSAEGVTDRALEYLDRRGSRPLFLWVHYFDPHFGYLARTEWDFATAPGYEGPVKSGMRFRELARLARDLAPADVDQIVRFYDSEIAFTDRQIGRLLDALRERGRFERTWIVFTADHGEEFLDHGSLGHTKTLHGELIHVPLLVKMPGLAPGRDERAVSTVDLFPTLLDALGLEPPCALSGRSLLEHGESPGGGKTAAAGGPGGATDAAGAHEPRPIFAETETRRGLRLSSVTLGSLKLVRNLNRGTRQVFDLSKDPGESTNLSAKLGAELELRRKVAALERILDAWIDECSERALNPREVDLSEAEDEHLEELGYGGDRR